MNNTVIYKSKEVSYENKDGKYCYLTVPENYEFKKLNFFETGEFIIVPKQVTLNGSLTINAKHLYTVLLGMRWFDSNAVFGNMTQIAEASGISRYTTKKLLEELEGFNLIKIDKFLCFGKVTIFITLTEQCQWTLPVVATGLPQRVGKVVECVFKQSDSRQETYHIQPY